MIIRGLASEALPVYGDGGNVRDWLYVADHAEALTLAPEHGRIGETYNIGAQRADQSRRDRAHLRPAR
jgi:dTDP-glucose 4,6-dehydratase